MMIAPKEFQSNTTLYRFVIEWIPLIENIQEIERGYSQPS